jgi:hypothetical protein
MWIGQHSTKQGWVSKTASILLLAFIISLSPYAQVAADAIFNPIPTPPPGVGSYGIEATKRQPPPTTAATIATPSSGASFTDSPITVSGLCTPDLFVQVYDNDVLVGAIECKSGSFSIQVTLFTGQNDIKATQFDDLGQASPDSNTATVSYNNASFQAFGTLITLTSAFGRRAANPGDTLTWPLILSGGSGPYAFSIDWGDGSKPDLKSQPLAGEVSIQHVYSKAGIYHVTVRVTDVNGVTAFIQLVAIANGQATAVSTSGDGKVKTVTVTKTIWAPAAVCLILLPATYWLGRRSELVSLHRQLEKNMENYKEL